MLDEPFAALDADGAALVATAVREAMGRGCAVLASAHSAGAFEQLGFAVLDAAARQAGLRTAPGEPPERGACAAGAAILMRLVKFPTPVARARAAQSVRPQAAESARPEPRERPYNDGAVPRGPAQGPAARSARRAEHGRACRALAAGAGGAGLRLRPGRRRAGRRGRGRRAVGRAGVLGDARGDARRECRERKRLYSSAADEPARSRGALRGEARRGLSSSWPWRRPPRSF